MDIERASVLADFEVVEIVDDNNSYPMVLGIDWSIDMNGVINIKKCIFEKKSLRVVIFLDPTKRSRYIDPVCDYESDNDLDCIYKITAWEKD